VFLGSILKKKAENSDLPKTPEEYRNGMEIDWKILSPFPFSKLASFSWSQTPLRNGDSMPLLSIHFKTEESINVQDIYVFYIHGGGFVEGSITGYSRAIVPLFDFIQKISLHSDEKLRFNIIMPEYRLAPEYLLPIAMEDCTDAYKYVINDLQINPDDIIIMGDSAGGHLSFSTTLKIIEENLPLPKMIIAFSPWTDLTISLDSHINNQNLEAILGFETLVKFSKWAAPSLELRQQYSLLSKSKELFSSFPPVLIHVGSYEILLDDAVKMYELLKDSKDTDTIIQIYEAQSHDFNLFIEWFPEAQDAAYAIFNFIKTHIN